MPRLSVVKLLVLLVGSCALAVSAAESVDTKQRIKAVRELGKGGSDSIPRLQEYLTDNSRDVREEAVKAVVAIGTQHSLDPLIRATRDNDPEVQSAATDGLVNFYVPGYVQTGITGSFKKMTTNVKGRFTDTNDQVVDPLVERDVRPQVISALGNLASGGSSMESRAHAARAIGVLRGRAAVPDLVAATRSKDDQVIYEALVALQKIRDDSAGPKISFLINDPKEKVQMTAIETTGLLNNHDALPELRSALERAKSRNVQRAALSAIAVLADPKDRPLFAQYFTSGDDALRTASSEGYARLRNPDDRLALSKAFGDEKKTAPRLAQAFALVAGGQTEMTANSPLQYLVESLNSRSYRNVAQTYLIEAAREKSVRESLYPSVTSGTREQKVGLAQVLARSGDRDSMPVLEKLSRDGDAEAGQEGLRALRMLKARLPG